MNETKRGIMKCNTKNLFNVKGALEKKALKVCKGGVTYAWSKMKRI